MSSALPPPCLHRSHCVLNEVSRYPLSYPQQTRSLRSTLDALHRQMAQVLSRLLALTSPLAPRSQQLSPSHRSHTPFVDPSHLRPPLTSEGHTTNTRWPAQGHKAAAGVLGVAGEVRDRGRWSRSRSPPYHHHHFNSTRPSTRLEHPTPRHYLWYGQRPGSSPERWNTSLSQAPSAFTRKGAGGGGLFCVRLKNATQKSQRKIRGGGGLFCVRYVGSPRVVPNAK